MRRIQLWFGFGKRAKSVAEPKPVAEPSRGSGPLLGFAQVRLGELGLGGLADRVQIVWNRRMRSTAGRALWPDALIELNPALKKIGLDEVERTLLHELAHLVAFERAGRRRIAPHGREWQQACSDLGIPGESASHHLELPCRQMRRKWRYVCPHCQTAVDRVRRMGRNTACWTCCRKLSGGEYDERFKFVEKRLAE